MIFNPNLVRSLAMSPGQAASAINPAMGIYPNVGYGAPGYTPGAGAPAATGSTQPSPRPVVNVGYDPSRNDLAKALLGQGYSNEPIRSPLELAGRLAQVYSGQSVEKEQVAKEQEAYARLVQSLGLPDVDRTAAFKEAAASSIPAIRNIGMQGLLAKPASKDFVKAGAGEAIYDPNTGKWIMPPEGTMPTFRPLTDPAERARYGILPEDKRPAQVGPKGELSFPGGAGTTITNNIGEDGSKLPAPEPGSVYATKPGPDGKPVVVMEPFGDPAKGYMRPVQIPVSGSKADAAATAADKATEAGGVNQANQAETMLDATASIKKEMTDATMPATGTFSRPFALLSGTAAGRVRSYVKALQSGVALNTMLKLKEASKVGATGFGALSERELDILINEIGALNADNTEPDIFLKTIDRIERQFNAVMDNVKKTVPPEALKAQGLDYLIGGQKPAAKGGGPPPGVDPATWAHMTPEERALWQK